MKRILNVISLAFIIGLIPFSLATGQEKKSEQRIKVVIADGSDAQVVIDTVFNDGMIKDSIKIKDGKVIYLGNRSKNANFITEDGKEHVYVSVTSDDNDTKKTVKKITIVSSDSASWTAREKTGDIFVFNDAGIDDSDSNEHEKIMRWVGKDENGTGKGMVIIKDGSVITTDGDDSFTYTIKADVSDSDGSDSESTKYVIKKDGMVISIEGSDYEKVKELANEIQDKIDSGNDTTDKNVVKKK